MGRRGSTACTVPRSPDYESSRRVWIQGSVHEPRPGLGWLLGTPWAASVDDESLRIVGIQGPVNHLGFKWLRLTFPESQVNDHNQGDQIQDSSQHPSPPLNDTQHELWGNWKQREGSLSIALNRAPSFLFQGWLWHLGGLGQVAVAVIGPVPHATLDAGGSIAQDAMQTTDEGPWA